MESYSTVLSNPQGVGETEEGNEGGGGGDPIAAEPGPPWPNQTDVVSRSADKGRAVATRKAKRAQKDASSSSSSSSSSRQQQGGVRLRNKRRSPLVTRIGRADDSLQELALPLGMSFAAVVSQVLDGKNVSRDRIPVDRLSMICTSAVKESIHNIYGDRFDHFTRNFEKSFGSTLRTLRLINEASIGELENKSINETSDGQGNSICNSFISSSCEAASTLRTPGSPSAIEEFQGDLLVNSLNNQLILHGQINQQLASVSHSTSGIGFNQSFLNTVEKSVMEQTRSNDLKAFEIGLTMRRLQLKQSQLALNSYANLLEKIKISMGFSKASFKEEKLRNQMQDVRNAELLKRCIDLLVAGLFIMSGFLAYGASIYSYQRIVEATSSCTYTPKESKSWWIPKPVSSFSSGWAMLRCHVQVISRMAFGFLMILVVAYSMFQRSSMSGPMMPVTFIILLLGAACGIAGMLCVDTLGGNGYRWLLYWETLCLLHFIANVFPSVLYYVLYGPVTVSQGARAITVPYWLRRCTFYSILLLILPTLAGLLPFASFSDWTEHFTEKITLWSVGNQNED